MPHLEEYNIWHLNSDLPDELLVQVLGYLPRSDLKCARLTCTRCGHTGAQWLFQRVYFAPRKAAIDPFLNISANPTFARNVTELVYDGRLFVLELTDYSEYKKVFDIKVRFHRNKIDVNKCLVNYTRLYNQQQSILQDHEDYEALLTGLNNFPNITTVIALDAFRKDCFGWTLRTDDHSWYRHRSALEFSSPIGSWSWPKDRLDDGILQTWDVRGIQNLFRAVSKRCQNVKDLHIAFQKSEAPMTIFEMDQDGYNDACTLAQRLTCLAMNLYICRDDNEDAWQTQYNALEGFLSQTKELRCIAMSGNIDGNVFKNRIWPHLDTLRVRGLCFDAAQFKTITQTHKNTLHTLILQNVTLTGVEGWVATANEVGKYLRLRRIDIHSLFDEVVGNYLKNEAGWAVARNFMQSIPQTRELDSQRGHHTMRHCTIIACPGEGEARDVHDDCWLSRIPRI